MSDGIAMRFSTKNFWFLSPLIVQQNDIFRIVCLSPLVRMAFFIEPFLERDLKCDPNKLNGVKLRV